MKLFRITTLMVLLIITGSTFAADELKVSALTMAPGESKTLSVALTNETTMIAFEFWLRLPDGISIVKDEDNDYAVTKNSTRLNKHELEVALDADGRYHFLCYSNPIRTIKENQGELLSMELLCDGTTAEGAYQATIEDVIFSDADKVRHDLNNCQFQIIVSSSLPGDVNKDETITIADVTALVNYLIDPSTGTAYNLQAADLDGNGSITIADVTELVKIIIGK